VRLTWKVTTTDPMYESAAAPSTRISVVDGGGSSGTTTTTTQQQQDPAPGPTAPADEIEPAPPTGGEDDTQGALVGDDDGAGDRAQRESGPSRDSGTTRAAPPGSAQPGGRKGGVAGRVGGFAKDNPVAATTLAATGAGVIAALAKPALLGGKILGGLGAPGMGGGSSHVPYGLTQLRRLLKLKKKGHRGGGDDDDLADQWLDLLDPDRNGR
jgi:hypothetical protein